MVILEAAIAQAEAMQVPQCIAVVDGGGHLLAYARMDGAKLLSEYSATQKAITAVSGRVATGEIAPDVDVKLALATHGQVTNLKGGLPIIVEGEVIGAIGVGSGSGAEDVKVAQAGINALLTLLAQPSSGQLGSMSQGAKPKLDGSSLPLTSSETLSPQDEDFDIEMDQLAKMFGAEETPEMSEGLNRLFAEEDPFTDEALTSTFGSSINSSPPPASDLSSDKSFDLSLEELFGDDL
jgi:uncharacterized protein GlcG (DUF336 family)